MGKFVFPRLEMFTPLRQWSARARTRTRSGAVTEVH